MSSWLKADEETEAQSLRCLALRMGAGSHALVWEGHREVEGIAGSARQHVPQGHHLPPPPQDHGLSSAYQLISSCCELFLEAALALPCTSSKMKADLPRNHTCSKENKAHLSPSCPILQHLLRALPVPSGGLFEVEERGGVEGRSHLDILQMGNLGSQGKVTHFRPPGSGPGFTKCPVATS